MDPSPAAGSRERRPPGPPGDCGPWDPGSEAELSFWLTFLLELAAHRTRCSPRFMQPMGEGGRCLRSELGSPAGQGGSDPRHSHPKAAVSRPPRPPPGDWSGVRPKGTGSCGVSRRAHAHLAPGHRAGARSSPVLSSCLPAACEPRPPAWARSTGPPPPRREPGPL